jgi:hypothetical protein
VLVRELLRHLEDRVIGKRHARVLGLQPVDRVAEDPTAAAEALSVARLLAVAAAPAGADAREEHAVSYRHRAHAGAYLLHGADGLMTEHRAGGRLGYVSLEDV